MPEKVKIDFFRIYRTAGTGIRRAAVFLGLGVNSAESQSLSDYQLSRHTGLRILPEQVAPEVLAEWKMQYRIWIVGCGFRELVDFLCVFLDKLYHVSSHIGRCYSTKAQSDFERLGLDKKLAKLESQFGISYAFSEQLASLYPIRNCFVHRLGRVGKSDVKDGDRLRLRFMKLSSVFTGASGKTEMIPDILDPLSPPFVAPEEGALGLQWSEEALSFGENEWVVLTPKHLTEILFFADMAARQITLSAVAFGRRNGLVVTE